MDRLRVFVRRFGFDLLVAVVALESALEVAFRHDPAMSPRTTVAFAAPAVAVVVLPLLGRHRWRFTAPASVWVLAATLSFVDGRLAFPAGLLAAGMAASFLLGQLPDTVQGRVGLAVVLGAAAIVVYGQPEHTPGDFLVLPVLFAIAWLAGFALRERVAQAEAAEERAIHAEREREAAARIAVAEERARIARELHDIVAHAVSVMVLQVGAVRHNLPESRTQDKQVLHGVEQTGRTALGEMRRLVGAMRHDGEDIQLTPQPGLGDLDSLLEQFGRAGLPVRLHIEGEHVPLPEAIDLSAYRIVQEGLTNALKHARASYADVVLRYGSQELQIDVRDDGDDSCTDDGLGHGLVGVRERVRIYGGDMTAGAVAGGGFILSTRLPLDGGR